MVEFVHIGLLVAGGLITAAGYYVRTEVMLGRGRSNRAVGGRIEALASELMAKIDGLKDAITALSVTMGRADERAAQHAREIERLDDRMTRMERRELERATSI